MKLKNIIRWTFVALVTMALLSPMEADAAKKRRSSSSRKTTTTTTSSRTKKKTATTTSRRRSSASRKTGSVTTATRDAATKASNPSTTATTDKKTSPGSALTKIKVAKPDLNEIMEATLDPSNKYYFPKLWEKYQRNDTVMTPEEYRYLYLGYMFQEDYDPYRESPYTQMTEDLRDKTTHTKEEIDTIRKYAEMALLDNPFDLRQMSFLVHVLKERNKNMSAKIWEYRLEHLLGAIKSTGTGEDVDNAWFVIYPMHEYDMVQLLGYEAVDVEYIEPGYDHLIVQPDGTVNFRNPASGFYFNVLVPQQQYDLKHPEDPS